MFKLTSHTAGNSFMIAAAASKSLLTFLFLSHKHLQLQPLSSGSWCVHAKGPIDDENSKPCLSLALSGPFRRSLSLHLSSAWRLRNALVQSCHCPTASEPIALQQHPKRSLFA
ncbi:hypothetical protein CY34DRAFT_602658 [Suillus luteus UH-Slu-Lm8-n1]|uniref:Uncharacterized protein n=1 Tax=Suillus luteus UH-Slu-Lm8-n1 TaxID=930992 RepID=A0A0D0A3U2_9AGAM|nr:hypothetical protein CY34DRAFT_602658 [Suillus luteus UH-Slu-Lm8-n1]